MIELDDTLIGRRVEAARDGWPRGTGPITRWLDRHFARRPVWVTGILVGFRPDGRAVVDLDKPSGPHPTVFDRSLLDLVEPDSP